MRNTLREIHSEPKTVHIIRKTPWGGLLRPVQGVYPCYPGLVNQSRQGSRASELGVDEGGLFAWPVSFSVPTESESEERWPRKECETSWVLWHVVDTITEQLFILTAPTGSTMQSTLTMVGEAPDVL